ncbi:hypothetical protein DOTSEDRAFT_24932 [Dothistroma septosporum NZE10]|uniref:Uncharacterized protein n=1 Tax=Dothistroma septosporum (strain NZE10 / CBS 128990) TaxID=675120 RepID=M2XKB7_DOTSN|nr:hypothetical protein DOTSEDRAFT_24932 [Dothistroma septosporum NZE10]
MGPFITPEPERIVATPISAPDTTLTFTSLVVPSQSRLSTKTYLGQQDLDGYLPEQRSARRVILLALFFGSSALCSIFISLGTPLRLTPLVNSFARPSP